MDILRDIILVFMYICMFTGLAAFMLGLFSTGVRSESATRPLRGDREAVPTNGCVGGIIVATFFFGLSAGFYGLYKLIS